MTRALQAAAQVVRSAVHVEFLYIINSSQNTIACPHHCLSRLQQSKSHYIRRDLNKWNTCKGYSMIGLTLSSFRQPKKYGGLF
ncbi:hypothetical protein E2C01_015359 [Portunus trituberculatus]|uniref:Uncharacterized protein n=1 Tax=Portunus trituberculatus TaxID=210409 RepID=A0A5B7DMI8_PORTR|nr:hypothetical protein [Portunus trituberculatus]